MFALKIKDRERYCWRMLLTGDPLSTVPTTVMMTTLVMTTDVPSNETGTTGGGGGLSTTMVIGIAAGVGALILTALFVGLITWLIKRRPKEEGRPQNSAVSNRAVRARPPSRFMDNRPWVADAYRRSFIDNYNYGQYSDCGKCYKPSSYVHKNVYVKNCNIVNRFVPSHDDHDYGKFTAPTWSSYTQKSVPVSSVFF